MVVLILLAIYALIWDLVSNLVLPYCQFSCCKNARLAYTKVVKHGSRLDALNVLNEDLVLFQTADGQGHGNGDCKWKSFWNSNNHQDHSDDSNLENTQQEFIGNQVLLGEDNDDDLEDQVGNNAEEHHKLGDV